MHRYFFGETSRSRLRVSRSMMTHLLTFHGVMPTYLDFVFVFGRQEEPRDLNFSGFREHMSLEKHRITQNHQIKSLQDRPMPVIGDDHYQMCFNLKGATFKTNTWKRQWEAMRLEHKISDSLPVLDREWTIRQVAIYHRFNVETGETLWILTKGDTDLQQRFKDLTSKNSLPAGNSFDTPLECFRSSLAAQVMYCQWSTEDWREQLRWLEDVIEEKVSSISQDPSTHANEVRVRWLFLDHVIKELRIANTLLVTFKTFKVGKTEFRKSPCLSKPM